MTELSGSAATDRDEPWCNCELFERDGRRFICPRHGERRGKLDELRAENERLRRGVEAISSMHMPDASVTIASGDPYREPYKSGCKGCNEPWPCSTFNTLAIAIRRERVAGRRSEPTNAGRVR